MSLGRKKKTTENIKEYEQIGENIRKARQKRGFTRKQLSDLLGVSLQAVANWECGRTMPTVIVFTELSSILGVSVYQLCGIKSKSEDFVSLSGFSREQKDAVQSYANYIYSTNAKDVISKKDTETAQPE